jgi:hypothetical protein
MTIEADRRVGGDAELASLLRTSGGLPVIQIVLDPDSDATSIRSAGVVAEQIPSFLVRLGRALGGEVPAQPAGPSSLAR